MVAGWAAHRIGRLRPPRPRVATNSPGVKQREPWRMAGQHCAMLVVCCHWRSNITVDERERESMARRIELGAGIGAAMLGAIGLIVLLFAPIIARCISGPVRTCPQRDLRFESLLQARVDVSVWGIIVGMLLLVLIGAAGAVAEARFGRHGGIIPLWSGAIMTLAGCLIAQGIGLFYFPAILALAVAATASLMRQRSRARSARAPISDEAESQPDTSQADNSWDG